MHVLQFEEVREQVPPDSRPRGDKLGPRSQEAIVLILTRRSNEKLMIGKDIEVIILGIKRNQVRLGISAPKDIAVHREDVFERIQREIRMPST